MMKRGAEAGLRSAVGLGICSTAPEILRKAEASERGRLLISAPMRSASYSRPRLTPSAQGPQRAAPGLGEGGRRWVPHPGRVAPATEKETKIGEH